jgi:hypothetical protein
MNETYKVLIMIIDETGNREKNKALKELSDALNNLNDAEFKLPVEQYKLI